MLIPDGDNAVRLIDGSGVFVVRRDTQLRVLNEYKDSLYMNGNIAYPWRPVGVSHRPILTPSLVPKCANFFDPFSL